LARRNAGLRPACRRRRPQPHQPTQKIGKGFARRLNCSVGLSQVRILIRVARGDQHALNSGSRIGWLRLPMRDGSTQSPAAIPDFQGRMDRSLP
jgi:hypothetical protein